MVTLKNDSTERLTAALAHASLMIPQVGIIVPIIIWITHKDKSKFVAFHALQATLFQAVMYLCMILGGICYIGSFFTMFLTDFTNTPSNNPPAFFFVPFVVIGLLFLVMGAFMLYGIIGAVLVALGRNFQYPFIEKYARRIVYKDSPVPVEPGQVP
jgi:uncharacterized Tic20 family protein